MWPYPRTVAHRGGGTLAPENTLAALRCGLAHGYRAVEFDVMLAKDGVPVVVHDVELGRTVAGSGAIPDYTAAQLAAMDAGGWFGARVCGRGRASVRGGGGVLPGARHLDEYRDQAGAGL